MVCLLAKSAYVLHYDCIFSSSDSFLHEGEEEFLMGLAPLSTLPLILFFFFQLANSGFYTILEETGVISYVSDALISLNQLTSWNKVKDT